MADSNKPITEARAGDDYQPPKSSGGAASTTTTGGTSAPVSVRVPAEYTASSYEELIPQLEQRMAEFKPLTEEELKKLRRKQKIEGIISGVSDAAQSVANLIATHNYAPNMYNAKEGMSAKAKERFEKEKAQRDADADIYFKYAMDIAKLKDADKERGLQAWQTEQNLVRQDRAFDAGREDRADDVEFRNKGFERDQKWHDEEVERWARQFEVNSANERRRINLEAQRLSQSLEQGQMTFNLGSGNGNVTLSADKLNAQTVSRIYSTLPADVRSKVQGDPIVRNGYIVGYKEPTTEAMLIAVGANVENSPATQNAIRQVAGLETGKKPSGY